MGLEPMKTERKTFYKIHTATTCEPCPTRAAAELRLRERAEPGTITRHTTSAETWDRLFTDKYTGRVAYLHGNKPA